MTWKWKWKLHGNGNGMDWNEKCFHFFAQDQFWCFFATECWTQKGKSHSEAGTGTGSGDNTDMADLQ